MTEVAWRARAQVLRLLESADRRLEDAGMRDHLMQLAHVQALVYVGDAVLLAAGLQPPEGAYNVPERPAGETPTAGAASADTGGLAPTVIVNADDLIHQADLDDDVGHTLCGVKHLAGLQWAAPAQVSCHVCSGVVAGNP